MKKQTAQEMEMNAYVLLPIVACFSLLCSQMLQLNLSCQGGKEGWVCPAAYMLQHGLFPLSRLWIHRLLAQNRVECHHQGLLAVDGPCQLSWEHIHVLSKMPYIPWRAKLTVKVDLGFSKYVVEIHTFFWHLANSRSSGRINCIKVFPFTTGDHIYNKMPGVRYLSKTFPH